MRVEISFKMSVLRPSETAWAVSYEGFQFTVHVVPESSKLNAFSCFWKTLRVSSELFGKRFGVGVSGGNKTKKLPPLGPVQLRVFLKGF